MLLEKIVGAKAVPRGPVEVRGQIVDVAVGFGGEVLARHRHEAEALLADGSDRLAGDAGHGAVREVCELILGAQGNLDAQLAPYLK